MKIKRTGYDIIAYLICLVLLIGVLIYLVVNWKSLPDTIAGHYNAAGVVDRWGNKSELLIMPIITWIMYIGLTVIGRFPQIWNTGVQVTEANQERVYRTLKDMLQTLKIIIVSVFTFITLCQALMKGLPIWFLPVFLIATFGSIFYFILKLVKIK